MNYTEHSSQLYSKYLNLVIGLEMALKQAQILNDLGPPHDNLSELYLDAANAMQGYFITIEAVKESAASLKGLKSLKAISPPELILVVKAIRNIIAHDGFLIPSYFTHNNFRDSINAYCYALEVDRVKSAINVLHSTRAETVPENQLQQQQNALNYIDDISINSKKINVPILVTKHASSFGRVLIDAISNSNKRSDFNEISKHRQSLKLSRLEDRIEQARRHPLLNDK